jgi:hypothetical protein
MTTRDNIYRTTRTDEEKEYSYWKYLSPERRLAEWREAEFYAELEETSICVHCGYNELNTDISHQTHRKRNGLLPEEVTKATISRREAEAKLRHNPDYWDLEGKYPKY